MSALRKDIVKISQEAKEFIDSGAYLEKISGIDQDSPWSPDSLKSCEVAFLQQAKAISEESRFHYLLFLGEGLRRNFGGIWSEASRLDPGNHELKELWGVYYPDTEHLDVVSNLLAQAEELDSGETWTALYQTAKALREGNPLENQTKF